MNKVPTCPTCGQPAKPTNTRYGVRHDCCGLHSWGGKPLVSPETHAARSRAHAVFDPLWQSRLMTRKEAYKRLAEKMGMSRRKCHIALMDEATALRVPMLVVEILRDRLDAGVSPEEREGT